MLKEAYGHDVMICVGIFGWHSRIISDQNDEGPETPSSRNAETVENVCSLVTS